MDKALAVACKTYGQKCHYDGGAVHRVAFGISDVSPLDFFHPNTTGQNELAQVTYYF